MEVEYESDDLNDDWIELIEEEEKDYTNFYR